MMQQNRQEPNQTESQQAIVQLVCAAQNGDENAFTSLFHAYTPLLNRLVDQYVAEGVPESDLRSDAIDAFMTAIKRFDSTQSGVTFGLYARICIGNRLIGTLRAYRRRCTPVSLEEIDPDSLQAGDESDPTLGIAETERYVDLCRQMDEVLSCSERQVWMLFISGLTAAQIARRLRIEKKSVENALFRARKKLRAHFSDS